MSAIQPTMMLIESSHLEQPTFTMIPVSNDAPYVECMFLPNTQQLAVISKIQKDTFHFFPRLDDNGDPVPARRRVASRGEYKEERKQIKTFYEYYIVKQSDIIAFVKSHAVNNIEFDIAPFLTPAERPEKKK